MQQENNIKKIKNILKGLGAGKTDQAVVRSSQAAPAIDNLTEAFRTSLGLGPTASPFSHYKKDENTDKAVVKQILLTSRPFRFSAGRKIGLDISPSIFNGLDKYKLNEFILRNAKRASAQHCIPDFEEEEEEE